MAKKKATPEPDDEEVRSSALTLAEQAKAIKVSNAEEFSAAGKFLLEVKAARKRVADFFAPMASAAHAAWKAVTTRRAEVDAPLERAETLIKPLLSRYQDRIAREQILAAEAAQAANDEAVALEERGDVEGAAALIADAAGSMPEAPKVAGLSFREEWSFEIVDAALVPREYLMVDEQKVRAYGKAMKESAAIPGVKFTMTKVPVGR